MPVAQEIVGVFVLRAQRARAVRIAAAESELLPGLDAQAAEDPVHLLVADFFHGPILSTGGAGGGSARCG